MHDGKGGPQGLMTTDDLIETGFQGFPIEGTGEAEQRRAVIGWICWLELVEEPEPLLGEGERKRFVGGSRLHGRGRLRRGCSADCLDELGHSGHRVRLLEEAERRQFDLHGFMYSGDELCRKDRVSSQ